MSNPRAMSGGSSLDWLAVAVVVTGRNYSTSSVATSPQTTLATRNCVSVRWPGPAIWHSIAPVPSRAATLGWRTESRWASGRARASSSCSLPFQAVELRRVRQRLDTQAPEVTRQGRRERDGFPSGCVCHAAGFLRDEVARRSRPGQFKHCGIRRQPANGQLGRRRNLAVEDPQRISFR